MLKEALDLSVAIFNPEQKELKHIYDHISTFEEAHLLSIKAMYDKKDIHKLVVILPGWCLGLNEDETKRVNKLAEEYAVKPI